MAAVFRLLDIPVGNQRKAELLTRQVLSGDYKEFYEYTKYGGVAFQDVPFSLPGTYKLLDKKFPDSKFILTVRDSPEVWYNSVVKFHTKLFGNGSLPTKSDLLKAEYVHPGWIWETFRHYKTPEDDIYNKNILIQHYQDYNNGVIEYFKSQPEKLLVINLKETNAIEKIAQFLNSRKSIEKIPWENKT